MTDERRQVRTPIRELPSALDRLDEFVDELGGRRPYVFLDYDGTLTPIVPDPREAEMPPEARAAVARLRDVCPVAVVSGRDLDDVRSLVGVEGIHYAGSHGFDLRDPDGASHQRGREYLPALARAAELLEPVLDELPGAFLERKRFALAVHYRLLENPADEPVVEGAVDEVLAEVPRVRKTGGKKLLELRPDLDWDKGMALLWILEQLGEKDDHGVTPVYLGDDLTDEDAFRVLGPRGTGVGVVIRGEDDRRETYADYTLPDPVSVQTFLNRLADRLGAPAA